MDGWRDSAADNQSDSSRCLPSCQPLPLHPYCFSSFSLCDNNQLNAFSRCSHHRFVLSAASELLLSDWYPAPQRALLANPNNAMSAGKQRFKAGHEEKEQLSNAADTVALSQQQQAESEQSQQSALQKRRLIVRRLPSPRARSPTSAAASSPFQPPLSAATSSQLNGRRRVLVVRRSDNDMTHSVLPPISGHPPATSQPSDSRLPSPHVPPAPLPSAGLSSLRERRILSRVAASSSAFSSFQSALAARVSRSASALCMTNASDEYRVRMERAAINEQSKRIARQAAAAHIDDQLTAADEEGGLPLPWEQSLRGATNHSVGVGGLFSGLYCKITQADMKEMEIVRSVKLIEEQPALSTQQPHARARGSRAARALAAAGGHQSVAAVRLMDEAARLQQLSRLGTLGSKGKVHRTQHGSLDDSIEHAVPHDEDEATLRLGDLIVRGTPLFDNLEPPPRLAPSATVGADSELQSAAGHTSGKTAGMECTDESGVLQSLRVDLPLSFVLSCSSVKFQQIHFPRDKQSAHISLHNTTHSTLHFAFNRLSYRCAFEQCSPQLPARSAYVLSHPTGVVLPRACIDLCVTFSPPSFGVWIERWQLQQIDHDGESQSVADTTVTLTGSSHPTLANHNRLSATQPSADSSARTKQQYSLDALSGSTAVDSLSDGELRCAFSRANGGLRLHYHRSLVTEWRRLWHDVRMLHRPLDRQRMEWQLSAQQIERAIEQLPRRHRHRQPALHGRLTELQALAAVVPSPHPARLAVLSSLISSLATALPPFASQLCLLHKHTLTPPWEVRAREAERQLMEREDAMGHMTDEQREQVAMEQRAREQQEEDEQYGEQQQQSAAEAVEVSEEQRRVLDERAKRRLEAAHVREVEQRADAEWRQRHDEYKQQLERESKPVLAGIIAAFEARAGAIGSDQPPPDTEQLSADAKQQVQLAVSFPTLVLEPEESVHEKGKGKAVKAKK